MTARTRSTVGLALLVFLVAGCEGAEEPETARPEQDETREGRVVVDDAGRSHAFAAPPERLVSLVPSATETVISLGEGDRLVARTDFDTASVVQDLPSVGGGLEPNVERLVALSPDLVIRFHAESDPSTPERLDRAGIRHFAVEPERIEDIRRVVRKLGRVLDRSEEAEARIRRMDHGLERVRAAVNGRERPTVAYLLGGNPPWVAGPRTFVDELLEVAGGENAFGDLPSRYAEVSLEALVTRDIDRILVVEGAAVPSGLQRDRVLRVPGLTRSPGLRLPEAALELARALHPAALP